MRPRTFVPRLWLRLEVPAMVPPLPRFARFAAIAALVAALSLVPGVRPARSAAAPRVLIVSVDGLRPDVLLRTNAPAMRALMARGSFTMWARTTPQSVTLPSHVSMLTGVEVRRHGITWNDDRSREHPVYPAVPTLFDLAHRAGISTALVAGKSKFVTFLRPGSLDHAFVPERGTFPDSLVADTAVAWIERFAPRVLFVHLPNGDLVGHDSGWGSEAQLASVAGADRALARLLAALERRGVLGTTLVIVSADHGGAGKSHGPNDTRSRTIPWIVAGPGVRAGLDLTTIRGLDVRTEDTFATACARLGLDRPFGIDGRVVSAAFGASDGR